MVDLPETFDEAADRLLAIETRIANRATKPIKTVFKRLLTKLLLVWPGDDASESEKIKAISRLNVEQFLKPMPTVESVIVAGLLEALAHGVTTALDQMGVPTGPADSLFKHSATSLLAPRVRTLHAIAQLKVDAGIALLRDARTLDEATSAVVVASPKANIERVAKTLTNQASNMAIQYVGESDPNFVVVWRAERDACVHCLAYQGEQLVNGDYPKGLTFADKPLNHNPVLSPPLHPNCRCTQWVLHKDVANAVKTALKREAKRSVLRGWSLPSESESVRVEAARLLLAKKPSMPRSVQTVARKAVTQGRFSQRGFPGTR